MNKHWYFLDSVYCPICGKTTTWRIRMWGERPAEWERRHRSLEVYDYCD